MRYLISGASGYIGSKLIESLLIDSAQLGLIYRSQKNNSTSSNLNNCEVYFADLSETLTIKLKHQYDVFIHLAASNDIDSIDSKVALTGTTLATKYCLEFCKASNINKFIYFSTFQALGKVDGFLSENTEPEPKNDYGITHLFAEEYVKMYNLTSDIDYTIIRPTNIYGAPLNVQIDRWSLVPNCFCKEAFEKQTITLLSSGNQQRDFLHLNDLVNVTKMIASDFSTFKNQTLHLSSGNNYSIVEIAHLVAEQYKIITNQNCRVIIKSEHPITPNQYSIDRTLIDKLDYKFSNWNSIIEEINSTFEKLLNQL